MSHKRIAMQPMYKPIITILSRSIMLSSQNLKVPLLRLKKEKLLIGNRR